MEPSKVDPSPEGMLESMSTGAVMMAVDSSSSEVGVTLHDAVPTINTKTATASLTISDGTTLPVTLVMSEPPNVENVSENSDLNSGHHVMSSMTLQDGKTTTQFFIEHITSDGKQVHTAEGETIQIGVNQGIGDTEPVPLLLHVTEGDAEESSDIHISGVSPENVQTLQGIPQAMYTIHLTEEQPREAMSAKQDISECNDSHEGDGTVTTQIDDVSLPDQPTLQFLATATRLEDFMDIVTTYKCKFCRFSCAWKSGLMSHIRNCHLDANRRSVSREIPLQSSELPVAKQEPDDNTPEPEVVSDIGESSNEVQTNSSNSSSTPTQPNIKLQEQERSDCALVGMDEVHTQVSSSGNSNLPPQERHIFLCGQCSKGFSSLEGCKQHMIKDHNLKLEPNITREKKNNLPKKRGRPRTRPVPSISHTSLGEDDFGFGVGQYDDESEDGGRLGSEEGLPAKRRIRPPRALEEDYFLGPRKKRMRRDSMSDRTYRCNERGCGYRFTSEPNLQYHSRCHIVDEKPFLCPECCEKSEHWRGLSMHLWKQHSIDMDLHTCPVCGYKTYSLFKLDNHRRIHSEEREFVCSTCGKGFKQLSQLRNHHVIHLDRKNMPEKRWYSEQECEICHRTFSDSKCLRKHQQAVHNKLKPYICTYCGHMSARKAMLQLHMRQHTGEKPFLCEHCEYRTGDHNSLRRHRMRHTGTKPYKCPHCPYACIQAISYKTHLKNKHPGMDGLYACTLCAFRSVSKENYINHMSDHKRGAIPSSANANGDCSATQHIPHENISSEHVTVQAPAQLHLPENTLQQLEGILPGNITAAQLIYSCLNALSQEGGTINLPPGVTTSSAGDGTQTITIQLPAPTAQDLTEPEQYYLTIQQQDGSTAATLLAPSSLEIDDNSVDATGKMAVLHPITIAQVEDGSESHSLDSSVFIGPNGDQVIGTEFTPVVISTQVEDNNVNIEDRSSQNLLHGATDC